jgi:hypothetical protein
MCMQTLTASRSTSHSRRCLAQTWLPVQRCGVSCHQLCIIPLLCALLLCVGLLCVRLQCVLLLCIRLTGSG